MIINESISTYHVFHYILVEKDFLIIDQSITKFLEHAAHLGGVSTNNDNDVSIKLIEENVFNRMTTTSVNDVIVKKLRQIM
jgi:hypothetical protein